VPETQFEDPAPETQDDVSEEETDTVLEEPEDADTLEEAETVSEEGAIRVVDSVQTPAEFGMLVSGDWIGVVAGWLNPVLVARAAELDIPFIVLFGIGEGPLDPVAWEILENRVGVLCSLNATRADAYQGIRPELVLPGEGKTGDEILGFSASLAQGQRVRLLSGSAAGQTGQVLRLEGELVFESGLALPAATVQLVTGEQIQMPQANLVILG
jgi:hypothetical protein